MQRREIEEHEPLEIYKITVDAVKRYSKGYKWLPAGYDKRDLERELYTNVLAELSNYEGKRGAVSTYINRVVEFDYMDMWRAAKAQKRKGESYGTLEYNDQINNNIIQDEYLTDSRQKGFEELRDAGAYIKVTTRKGATGGELDTEEYKSWSEDVEIDLEQTSGRIYDGKQDKNETIEKSKITFKKIIAQDKRFIEAQRKADETIGRRKRDRYTPNWEYLNQDYKELLNNLHSVVNRASRGDCEAVDIIIDIDQAVGWLKKEERQAFLLWYQGYKPFQIRGLMKHKSSIKTDNIIKRAIKNITYILSSKKNQENFIEKRKKEEQKTNNIYVGVGVGWWIEPSHPTRQQQEDVIEHDPAAVYCAGLDIETLEEHERKPVKEYCRGCKKPISTTGKCLNVIFGKHGAQAEDVKTYKDKSALLFAGEVVINRQKVYQGKTIITENTDGKRTAYKVKHENDYYIMAESLSGGYIECFDRYSLEKGKIKHEIN